MEFCTKSPPSDTTDVRLAGVWPIDPCSVPRSSGSRLDGEGERAVQPSACPTDHFLRCRGLDWSSFCLVNSATVPGSLAPWLASHKLPALSKVTPFGGKKMVLVMVTLGVGEPDLASSFFAYSTTVWPMGPGLNQRFPDVSKAMLSAARAFIVSTSPVEIFISAGEPDFAIKGEPGSSCSSGERNVGCRGSERAA